MIEANNFACKQEQSSNALRQAQGPGLNSADSCD